MHSVQSEPTGGIQQTLTVDHELTSHHKSKFLGLHWHFWNQAQAAGPTQLLCPHVGARVLGTFISAMSACINGQCSPGHVGKLELRKKLKLSKGKNFDAWKSSCWKERDVFVKDGNKHHLSNCFLSRFPRKESIKYKKWGGGRAYIHEGKLIRV